MIPNKMNRFPSVTTLGVEHGKVPPQCPDIEECVLGAMLMDQSCVDDVASILKAESFYRDQNQKIFQAIIDLKNRGKVIDLLTVTAELRARKELEEIGGPVYVTTLTSRVDITTSNGYDQLRLRTTYTPSATGDTNGNTGDFSWDDSYFYIKTSAGWKRAALSTF